ncbi:MAG: hypothetical protein RLZZ297_222 [Chloroflexota bacterium]|jgi:DNA replication and repair protein RecF
MHISRLVLRDFRAYHRLDLALSPGVTLLYGPNAAGKTTVLEAVTVLALSKSARTNTDRELIAWDAAHNDLTPATARVSGVVERSDRTTQLDVIVQARGDAVVAGSSGGTATKVLRVDGRPVRASDLIGFVRMVFFAPTDLELLTGAPAERRRWLDAMLSQLDSAYLRALNHYQKVMTQRNGLLRQWRDRGVPRQFRSELAFWDAQLAETGAVIMTQRRAALADLSTHAAAHYATISASTRRLHATYAPSMQAEWHTSSDAQQALLAALQQSHTDDIARQQTSVGPHRDDIFVHDEGVDLGAYGSRGQQRSSVLALKLAEVAVMHARSGERPVLLLDDVLSELDAVRRTHVTELVAQPGQQSILTATGVAEFTPAFLAQAQVLRVDHGHIATLD